MTTLPLEVHMVTGEAEFFLHGRSGVSPAVSMKYENVSYEMASQIIDLASYGISFDRKPTVLTFHSLSDFVLNDSGKRRRRDLHNRAFRYMYATDQHLLRLPASPTKDDRAFKAHLRSVASVNMAAIFVIAPC